jgi:hypothetical protein
MKTLSSIVTISCLILLGCQDDDSNKCGCAGTNTILTNSSNRYATIIETLDGFQIFSDEDGFLQPCKELDASLKINGKPVLISGQIKKSCKTIDPNFPINPVQFSNIIPLQNKYDRLDITLTIIKSEDYGYDEGFGYFIEDKRIIGGAKILAPTISELEGNQVYDTEEKAYLNGLLMVYAVRNATTDISKEVLQYIKVLN